MRQRGNLCPSLARRANLGRGDVEKPNKKETVRPPQPDGPPLLDINPQRFERQLLLRQVVGLGKQVFEAFGQTVDFLRQIDDVLVFREQPVHPRLGVGRGLRRQQLRTEEPRVDDGSVNPDSIFRVVPCGSQGRAAWSTSSPPYRPQTAAPQCAFQTSTTHTLSAARCRFPHRCKRAPAATLG